MNPYQIVFEIPTRALTHTRLVRGPRARARIGSVNRVSGSSGHVCAPDMKLFARTSPFNSRAVPNDSTGFLHFHTVTMEILTIATAQDEGHSPGMLRLLGKFSPPSMTEREMHRDAFLTFRERAQERCKLGRTRYINRHNTNWRLQEPDGYVLINFTGTETSFKTLRHLKNHNIQKYIYFYVYMPYIHTHHTITRKNLIQIFHHTIRKFCIILLQEKI